MAKAQLEFEQPGTGHQDRLLMAEDPQGGVVPAGRRAP
jgi:hypothetical protein